MASISARPGLRLAADSTRHLTAAVRWSLLGSLVVVALALVVRRISGAFVVLPGSAVLVGVAALASLATAAVRILGAGDVGTRYSVHSAARYSAPSTQHPVRSARGWMLFALPGVAAILLLAAVTLPGASVVGLIAAWFLVALAEAGTWLLRFDARGGRAANQQPAAESESAEAELPPNLVQQVTRVVDKAGGESIHAVLRAAVPAGDRQTALHVAFCPPLAAAPELAAHALESDAEVRITQAESFGARLEVRLPQAAATEQALLVELLGSVKGPSA